MGIVLLYLSLSCFVSVPFGVALVRCWVRPASLPEPYVRYRPARHPAVLDAEALLPDAYAAYGALYDSPPGPAAR